VKLIPPKFLAATLGHNLKKKLKKSSIVHEMRTILPIRVAFIKVSRVRAGRKPKMQPQIN